MGGRYWSPASLVELLGQQPASLRGFWYHANNYRALACAFTQNHSTNARAPLQHSIPGNFGAGPHGTVMAHSLPSGYRTTACM